VLITNDLIAGGWDSVGTGLSTTYSSAGFNDTAEVKVPNADLPNSKYYYQARSINAFNKSSIFLFGSRDYSNFETILPGAESLIPPSQ
jgi:hypothetical protein